MEISCLSSYDGMSGVKTHKGASHQKRFFMDQLEKLVAHLVGLARETRGLVRNPGEKDGNGECLLIVLLDREHFPLIRLQVTIRGRRSALSIQMTDQICTTLQSWVYLQKIPRGQAGL